MLTGATPTANGNGRAKTNPTKSPLAGVKGIGNPQHFIAGGQGALPQDSNGKPWNGEYVFSSGYLARVNAKTQIGADDGNADPSGGTIGQVSFTALSGKSFSGAGNTVHSTAMAFQGYYDSVWGNQKAAVFFDTAAMATALAGRTLTGVSLRFRTRYAFNSGGVTALVGTHNSANTITAWPAGVRTSLVKAPGCKANKWTTVQLPLSSAQAFQAGTMKGITFGPASNTSKTYYGYHYMTGANAPVLTFTYSA
jgi:hypothetical protein